MLAHEGREGKVSVPGSSKGVTMNYGLVNPSMDTVTHSDGQRTDALGGAGAAPHVLRDARQAPGMIYSMSSLS